MIKRTLLLILLAATVTAVAAERPLFSEIEVSSEPGEDGVRVYTVRLAPDRTATYDLIVYDCVYRQEFPWENFRGKKYTKVHEPVSFVYREKVPRLVAELDHYTNFRVPLSMERLVAAYGHKVFNKDEAVTVDRIRISALKGGVTQWIYEVPAQGKQSGAKLTACLKEPPAPEDP